MVDILQIFVVIIVVFLLFLTAETLFSFCRLYAWLKKKVGGEEDIRLVPAGKYRRTSVSHDWTDASVLLLSEEELYSTLQQHQQPQQPQLEKATSWLPFGQTKVSQANVSDSLLDVDHRPHRHCHHHHDHHRSTSSFRSQSRRTSSTRLFPDQGSRSRRRSVSTGFPQDKVLHASDFIKRVQVEWQSGDFVCHHCKRGLSGHRYVLHDERSYCKLCFEHLFANICERCKAPITCDSKDLSCKNRHWHGDCFHCSACHCSLENQAFAFKDRSLFCASCYHSRFASRCVRCGDVFTAGTKKYEHRGKQWHAECFSCKTCHKLIGTSSFIPKGDDVICVPCYERQLSDDCCKCHKPIAGDGVVYKGAPYHRACFDCSQCGRSLASEKYTSLHDKPLCSHCYCATYAPSCHACRLPISGLNEGTGKGAGVRYISLDTRQWHEGCFACVKCRLALVGRAFMTEADDVLCPSCCRED